MKKILIATTALVATAGVASADITLSGYGRLGVVVDETAAVAAKDPVAGKALTAAPTHASGVTVTTTTTAVNATTLGTLVADLAAIKAARDADLSITATEAANYAKDIAQAEANIAQILGTPGTAAVAAKSTTSTYSRLQFNITGSTVADNGMAFGGKMRIQTTGATSPAAGPQVHLKMGDVTVYGGNIPGPLDNMPNVYGKTVGFSGGTFQGLVTSGDKLGYSSAGNGAGAMQVDYSNGNVTVMAAHQPGTDINQAVISFSLDGLTVAAGGQFSKKQAEDLSVVSLGYTFGDVSFALASGELDKIRKTTLSASGSIGNGVSLQGYIVEKEKEKNNGWGLGISYDLGGGAKFAAGYETRHDKSNRAEAGFHFNF